MEFYSPSSLEAFERNDPPMEGLMQSIEVSSSDEGSGDETPAVDAFMEDDAGSNATPMAESGEDSDGDTSEVDELIEDDAGSDNDSLPMEDQMMSVDEDEYHERVEPVKVQGFDAQPLSEKIRIAKTYNPKGVRIVGLKQGNAQHMAGYLSFRDTKVFLRWVHHLINSLLTDWLIDRKDGICNGWDRSLPKNYLFGIIASLDISQAQLVTGNIFHITAEMLGVNEGYRDVPAFRWLHAMHSVISAYPTHFPNDDSEGYMLHSSENWYRALKVVRFCQQKFVENKFEHIWDYNGPRTSVLALVPYWLSNTDESVDDEFPDADEVPGSPGQEEVAVNIEEN